MEYVSEAEGERVVSAVLAAAALLATVVDETVGGKADAAGVDKDVEEVVVVDVDDEFDVDSFAKAAAAEVRDDEGVEDAVSAFLKDLEVLE